MNIIYEPTGKAREYAPLAVNLYSGCSHGCGPGNSNQDLINPYGMEAD